MREQIDAELLDLDDPYPEEIAVDGQKVYEYGLTSEEENGIVKTLRNNQVPSSLSKTLDKQMDELMSPDDMMMPKEPVTKEKVKSAAKNLGMFAAEMIPGVGEEIAAKRFEEAIKAGDKVGAGVEAAAGILGIVPGVGDLVAQGVRKTKAPLRKLFDKLPQKEIDELPKQPDKNRIFGYHGTARERKPDEPFFDIGFARKNDQFLGEGFYFTLDPKVAEEYANLRAFRDFDVSPIQKGKDPVLTHRETGKKTTVANLQKGLDVDGNPLTMGQSVSRFDLSNIEKPYVVRTEKQRKELKAKIPQLKEEGYDAVLFADFKDRSKQIMVFPEHINKIDTSSMAGRMGTESVSPLEIGTSPAAEGGKLLANYTADTAKDLVQKAKSAKVGLNPELIGKKVDAGKQVAIRLNLNSSIPDAPKGLDKLQTVHDKRPTGTALSYLPFATVENVEFFVNQTGRRDIASKIKGLAVKEAKNKFPAMSVNGQFNPSRNVLEEMGDDVVEVGFNPANTHLFVDMATGQAIKSADVATVIGNRVYAKGVTYMKRAEAPEPKAASDGTELGSEVRYKFKRGGLMARK